MHKYKAMSDCFKALMAPKIQSRVFVWSMYVIYCYCLILNACLFCSLIELLLPMKPTKIRRAIKSFPMRWVIRHGLPTKYLLFFLQNVK